MGEGLFLSLRLFVRAKTSGIRMNEQELAPCPIRGRLPGFIGLFPPPALDKMFYSSHISKAYA